jgi:hypothetical protein
MQPILREHKIVPTQIPTFRKHEKNMHEIQGNNTHKSPHFFIPKKPRHKNVFFFSKLPLTLSLSFHT